MEILHSFRLTIRNVNSNIEDVIVITALGFRLTIRNVNAIKFSSFV